MTFSWDWNLATLIAIGVQIVFLIVYLVKTNGKAHSAYALAEDALERADKAHESIMVVNASMSLLREQVVRDHPSHFALSAMEKRLTEEIHRVGNRLDQALDRKLPSK